MEKAKASRWRKMVPLCSSSVQLFATPWTVARWASLSMEFSRQEYWSGLPFATLGDLPNPRMEPASPALAGRFFTTNITWETWSPLRKPELLHQPKSTESIGVGRVSKAAPAPLEEVMEDEAEREQGLTLRVLRAVLKSSDFI